MIGHTIGHQSDIDRTRSDTDRTVPDTDRTVSRASLSSPRPEKGVALIKPLRLIAMGYLLPRRRRRARCLEPAVAAPARLTRWVSSRCLSSPPTSRSAGARQTSARPRVSPTLGRTGREADGPTHRNPDRQHSDTGPTVSPSHQGAVHRVATCDACTACAPGRPGWAKSDDGILTNVWVTMVLGCT